MTERLWYADSVIYTIDIPPFQDGIGDFQGATSRIDYLAELGINRIRLLPFYGSPFCDNRHDIQDCYNISENLGTSAEVK